MKNLAAKLRKWAIFGLIGAGLLALLIPLLVALLALVAVVVIAVLFLAMPLFWIGGKA